MDAIQNDELLGIPNGHLLYRSKRKHLENIGEPRPWQFVMVFPLPGTDAGEGIEGGNGYIQECETCNFFEETNNAPRS